MKGAVPSTFNINPLHSHNPMRGVLLCLHFPDGKSEAQAILSDLPQIIQVVSGRAGIQTRAVWPAVPMLLGECGPGPGLVDSKRD